MGVLELVDRPGACRRSLAADPHAWIERLLVASVRRAQVTRAQGGRQRDPPEPRPVLSGRHAFRLASIAPEVCLVSTWSREDLLVAWGPSEHRFKRARQSPLERFNLEIGRRWNVAEVFPTTRPDPPRRRCADRTRRRVGRLSPPQPRRSLGQILCETDRDALPELKGRGPSSQPRHAPLKRIDGRATSRHVTLARSLAAEARSSGGVAGSTGRVAAPPARA